MTKKDLKRILILHERGLDRKMCVQAIIETSKSSYDAAQTIDEFYNTPQAKFGQGAEFLKDPVFKEGPNWYFYDETWANATGPFLNEAAARTALEYYCKQLNKSYKGVKI
jgi:hypothetical protein